MVTLSEVMAGLSAEQRAAVEARYQALATELRETDEALGDYTVNLIRSLPEAAAKLRAENDTLRARVAELEAGITKFLHETAGPVGRLAARVPDRHDGAIGTDIFCVQAGYPFLRALRDVPSAGAVPK